MKKEMKVIDLPLVLRKKILFDTPAVDSDPAKYFLDRIDWTKATNEERLAYAELEFPVGTVFMSAYQNGHGTVEFYKESDNGIYCHGGFFPIEAKYIYLDGKWAEILSRPDEVEKPKYTFKVGDRPKWTKEMIEALPHGTVLECASIMPDIFTYNGEPLIDGRITKINGSCMYFNSVNKNAKIISLPTEQKETNKTIFFDTSDHSTDAMVYLISTIRKKTEPEFKAGDEIIFEDGEYDIVSVVGDNAWIKQPQQQYGRIVPVSSFRKLDPDKKYRDIAKALIDEKFLSRNTDTNVTTLRNKDLESMLIEALKKTVE